MWVGPLYNTRDWCAEGRSMEQAGATVVQVGCACRGPCTSLLQEELLTSSVSGGHHGPFNELVAL